jgi:hypothetical protein
MNKENTMDKAYIKKAYHETEDGQKDLGFYIGFEKDTSKRYRGSIKPKGNLLLQDEFEVDKAVLIDLIQKHETCFVGTKYGHYIHTSLFVFEINFYNKQERFIDTLIPGFETIKNYTHFSSFSINRILLDILL